MGMPPARWLRIAALARRLPLLTVQRAVLGQQHDRQADQG